MPRTSAAARITRSPLTSGYARDKRHVANCTASSVHTGASATGAENRTLASRLFRADGCAIVASGEFAP